MTDSTTCFSASDIEAMSKGFRTNFINSLSGFKAAALLGTTDGTTNNLAIMSSIVHVGANPPLLGMIMRPHTVQRDSLGNIKRQGVYTLNHVHTNWVDKAHQTSARYESNESEFDKVNLTPWYSNTFSAPYVAESAIKLGLKVAQHFTLCNKTEMVIGEVQQVFINEKYVDAEGYANIEHAGTACISGLDSYHSTSQIAQFSYAKPDQPLNKR